MKNNKQYRISYTKQSSLVEQSFYIIFTFFGVWIFSKNLSTMVNALENLSFPEHNFIIISFVAFIFYFVWCISGLIDSFKDETSVRDFGFVGDFKKMEGVIDIEPKRQKARVYKKVNIQIQTNKK